MAVLIVLVVLGTSIWVAADASRLGAASGRLGGGFADMGPASWFFACLLIWIIGFPLYLATRPRYLALKRAQLTGTPLEAPLESREEAPGMGGSVADELIKLAKLRYSGALSDNEFETQKARLLAP